MVSGVVGRVLQQERLRQGRSLEEITRVTRIAPRFLEAIESEQFERLPGLVFARNFVRQYAEALGADAEPLLAEMPRPDIEAAKLPEAPLRDRNPEWDPRWNSAIASVVWLAIAVGASYGAYVHFNRPLEARADKIEQSQPLKAAAAAPAPAPAEPAGTPAPAAAETPQAAATPQPDSNHAVRVVLVAKEPSWVQVVADGKTAFTGTLQPNDSRAVEADDQIKLVAGNAGGLNVSLNGKALDPLGPSGQVRTITLTAEGPQRVAQIQRPAPDPL